MDSNDWLPPDVRRIVEFSREVAGGPDKMTYQVRLLPETNGDTLKRIELILSLSVK